MLTIIAQDVRIDRPSQRPAFKGGSDGTMMTEALIETIAAEMSDQMDAHGSRHCHQRSGFATTSASGKPAKEMALPPVARPMATRVHTALRLLLKALLLPLKWPYLIETTFLLRTSRVLAEKEPRRSRAKLTSPVVVESAPPEVLTVSPRAAA